MLAGYLSFFWNPVDNLSQVLNFQNFNNRLEWLEIHPKYFIDLNHQEHKLHKNIEHQIVVQNQELSAFLFLFLVDSQNKDGYLTFLSFISSS